MTKLFAVAAATALMITPAFAQEIPQAVKARQGQFNILALNLGILGGMARGTVDFDQETAQAAADSLVAVSMVKQHAMWPEGTSADEIDGTRAKPEIWADMADFQSKWDAVGEAATAMQAAIGEGAEAIGPNMGPLGNACKDCHDSYRVPQ